MYGRENALIFFYDQHLPERGSSKPICHKAIVVQMENVMFPIVIHDQIED